MNQAIPGPNEAPFIGSAYPFAQEGPEFLVRMASTYGKIARFHAFHHPIHLVSDPDLIREVLVTKAKHFRKSDRDLKILSKFVGLGLLTTNDEQHKRQRRLAQPAFHARRIESYAETMVAYAQRLTGKWNGGQVIDVSEQMMELTMLIVCKTLFDVNWEHMDHEATRIGDAIAELQEVVDSDYNLPFVPPLWLPTRNNRRTKAARSVINETINRIVAERRANSLNGEIQDTGDLLSMLLMAHHDEGAAMSEDEIRDQLLTLFIAGHETTSNALTWTWYLLSRHPEVEAKMHLEIDAVLGGHPPTLADLPNLPYTEMVLKESMRLFPPAWVLTARQANEEISIGEYRIPKDGLVMISPYVLHRLPQYFPEPEQFDPERFTPAREAKLPKYVYMPFGGGPRICIGNSFAMMEAHLILATIAQNFRFELDPAQKIELRAQVTLSSAHGMKMLVLERQTPDVTEQHQEEITDADHESHAAPRQHREPELAVR